MSLGIALFFSTSWNGMRAEQSLKDYTLGFVDSGFAFRISSLKETGNDRIIAQLFYDPNLKEILRYAPVLRNSMVIHKETGETLRVPWIGRDLLSQGLDPKFESNPRKKTKLNFEDRAGSSTIPQFLFSRSLFQELGEKEVYQYSIQGKPRSISRSAIRIIDSEGGAYVVQDILAMQEELNLIDQISFLDLYLPKDSPKELSSKMESLLRDKFKDSRDWKIESLNEILGRAEAALKSFRMNLVVVASISVLIAFFMISQNLSGLYFQRRSEIAIIRTLGAPQVQSSLLFLLQSLLVGIPGTVLGIFLGVYFTDFISVSETTVTDRFQVRSYETPPAILIFTSSAIGVIGSLLAGILPSFRAGKIPPIGILREAENPTIPESIYRWLLALGLISVIPGFLFAFALPPNQWSGLVGIGFLIGGQILLLPVGFRFLANLSPSYFPSLKIGMEEIRSRPLGNTFSAGTFMLAISLVFTLTTLTRSYKTSLVNWVDSENPFDFSIINGRHLDQGLMGGVPISIAEKILNLPETKAINPFVIQTNLPVGDRVYVLHAYQSQETEALSTKEPEILVSSNLSFLDKKNPGDFVRIPTPKFGFVDFKIVGTKEHFYSERGTIIMGLRDYDKYFGIESFNSVRVSIQPGVNPRDYQNRLKILIQDIPDLVIFDSEGLKNIYLSGLQKVFGTLESLKWTAVFISILSVFIAVLHTLMEKIKIFAVLSTLGTTAFQQWKILFFSASSLLWNGGVLGVVSSVLLSPIVIYVVNKNAFGWTLEFDFPWMGIPFFFLGIPLLCLAASIFPLLRLKQTSLRETLKSDS
jgi:putative ABC transport system permease protein